MTMKAFDRLLLKNRRAVITVNSLPALIFPPHCLGHVNAHFWSFWIFNYLIKKTMSFSTFHTHWNLYFINAETRSAYNLRSQWKWCDVSMEMVWRGAVFLLRRQKRYTYLWTYQTNLFSCFLLWNNATRKMPSAENVSTDLQPAVCRAEKGYCEKLLSSRSHQ